MGGVIGKRIAAALYKRQLAYKAYQAAKGYRLSFGPSPANCNTYFANCCKCCKGTTTQVCCGNCDVGSTNFTFKLVRFDTGTTEATCTCTKTGTQWLGSFSYNGCSFTVTIQCLSNSLNIIIAKAGVTVFTTSWSTCNLSTPMSGNLGGCALNVPYVVQVTPTSTLYCTCTGCPSSTTRDFSITVSGITNGSCTDCATANGTRTLTWNNNCNWQSSTFEMCIGGTLDDLYQYTLQYAGGVTTLTLHQTVHFPNLTVLTWSASGCPKSGLSLTVSGGGACNSGTSVTLS